MKKLSSLIVKVLLATTTVVFASSNVSAANLMVGDLNVTDIAVNGGTDSLNVGTSCMRVSAAVSALCPSGWVAIQNNNKLLLSAAMQAKSTNGKITFYYADSGSTTLQHCPGFVMTPCSVISISLQP